MFTNVMSAIPNIVAAGLIGFVGYVIARLISEPVRALTSGIDKYAPKLGLGESFRLSRLLGQLVFIAIFRKVYPTVGIVSECTGVYYRCQAMGPRRSVVGRRRRSR